MTCSPQSVCALSLRRRPGQTERPLPPATSSRSGPARRSRLALRRGSERHEGHRPAVHHDRHRVGVVPDRSARGRAHRRSRHTIELLHRVAYELSHGRLEAPRGHRRKRLGVARRGPRRRGRQTRGRQRLISAGRCDRAHTAPQPKTRARRHRLRRTQGSASNDEHPSRDRGLGRRRARCPRPTDPFVERGRLLGNP
jgi:hypothetical protein